MILLYPQEWYQCLNYQSLQLSQVQAETLLNCQWYSPAKMMFFKISKEVHIITNISSQSVELLLLHLL